MAISAQKANVWLAFGTAAERQAIWDALRSEDKLRIGAPVVVPDDHWSMWIKGVQSGGGGGVAQGPAGPQGPIGPGFSGYDDVQLLLPGVTTDATVTALSINYNATVAGEYYISWYTQTDPLGGPAAIAIEVDASPVAEGLCVANPADGVVMGGGFVSRTLTVGVHVVTIDLTSVNGAGSDVTMQRARIAVWFARP